MKKFILIVFYFLISVAAGAESPLINAKAPDFSLSDQHDQRVSLSNLEGKVIVLVASDKEGTKQNPAWRKALTERYGGRVFIQGVGDLRNVPFFLKGSFKRDLQKDPASILLDWKGEIFIAYGLAEHVSNIVLIDQKGYVQYLHSGCAEPGAVGDLFEKIDRCLE